jgi:signal transduction histidine kinase/CheY-like chemotaxis protein
MNNNEKNQLYFDQIAHFYQNFPLGLIASFTNATILVIVLRNVIDRQILLFWFFAVLIVTFIRFMIYIRYRQLKFSPTDIKLAGNLFITGTALSGIVWGTVGLFSFPHNSILYEAFVAFVLGGMVAGSAAAYSVLMKGFLAFTVPALLPLTIRFFTIGDIIHLTMGGMLILFEVLIIIIAYFMHRMTNNSIMLKYENLRLISSLKESKEKAEHLNTQLLKEINERKKAETELKRHKQQLEVLVRERTHELKLTNEQLKKEIQKRKQIENELLKIQRLEALAVLAGGIAHDFNNILTGILGNLSLAKLYVKPGEKLYAFLTEAEKASVRAKDLTQQIITFSKGGAPIKKPADIRETIKESASFVLMGSNVKCDFEFPDNLWNVEIDETQMCQAIQNIILNAKESMPDGGRIKVACENIIISDDSPLPLNPGRYIRITIKDQGVGIDNKYIDKIFDPFFSTKHGGSGLGLSVTYSVIKRHHGHITVSSKPGKGTTFYIYLPASGKEPSASREATHLYKGKGKILVMDDDKVVRNLIKEMLPELGYEVEVAKDGEEALELYEKALHKDEPFDVVILDLTVAGGMGGKEAIKRLLEIDSKVRAIVSSGYSNDPVIANFKHYGFKGFIIKPYNIHEISRIIHETINAPD